MAPAEAIAKEQLRIEVVYCPVPGQAELVPLRLAAGATLRDAVVASGLLERFGLAMDSLGALRVGIWSKVREHDTPLRDRDRVEIYRPLTVDPKEARRLRYKRARKPGAAGA